MEITKQLEKNRRSFCPRTNEISGGMQKKKGFKKPFGKQAWALCVLYLHYLLL